MELITGLSMVQKREIPIEMRLQSKILKKNTFPVNNQNEGFILVTLK